MEQLFHEEIINKNSAIPLYFQLYSYMEDLIQKGTLKDGDRLPAEDKMAEMLGISRPTVRQAFRELTNKGLVQRKRSKGTVVTKPKMLSKFLTELTSYQDELSASNMQVKTKVVAFEVVKDHMEAQNVLKSDLLIRISRLRYGDGVPLVYLDTYLPYQQYAKIFEHDLEKESMYETMRNLGNPIVSVHRVLRAAKADKQIAGYLEIGTNDVILLTETIGKNEAGEAMEYSIARYNGEFANFEIELKV